LLIGLQRREREACLAKRVICAEHVLVEALQVQALVPACAVDLEVKRLIPLRVQRLLQDLGLLRIRFPCAANMHAHNTHKWINRPMKICSLEVAPAEHRERQYGWARKIPTALPAASMGTGKAFVGIKDFEEIVLVQVCILGVQRRG
jgi:hypothetical protein